MYLKNNVNHKNMSVIWHYLKNFARKNGLQEKDVNIFEMLSLDYPDDYNNAVDFYTDSTKWSPQQKYVDCYLKAKEITGEDDFFRRCGRTVLKFNTIKSFKDLALVFTGPNEAYKMFPTLLGDWNDTKKAEVLQQAIYDNKEKVSKTIIKYKIHPHIPYELDFCSGKHIQGILESMPTAWPRYLWQPWKKLPMATVRQVMVQYDPIKLFNSIYFKKFDLRALLDEGELSIVDPQTKERMIIGKEVFLVKSTIFNKFEYIGEHSYFFDEAGRGRTGILITETVKVGGETVCEKGTIFNGPHFILEIENEESPLKKRILNFRQSNRLNDFVLNEVEKNIKIIRREILEKEKLNESLLTLKNNLEKTIESKKNELEATQKKIIKKEKILFENQIAGGFVHEVRNSLAGSQLAIRSLYNYKGTEKSLKDTFSEIIEEIKNDSGNETKGKIDKIEKLAGDLEVVFTETEGAVESVLGLTRKIRLYTKAASYKKSTDKVSIRNILNIIKKRQGRLLEKNQITLNIAGPELVVKADKGAFVSIFENMIINSIDAIREKKPDSGTIKITTELNDNIVISVKDNGIGISEDKVKRIFDLFYTEKTNGNGIGLAIAKRFISAYGGKIYANSTPGPGTEMIISFEKSILWGDDEKATGSDRGRRRSHIERPASPVVQQV